MLFYKGISKKALYNLNSYNYLPCKFSARYNTCILYLSKSKKVAETYARNLDGFVLTITENNLSIHKSNHSNQFICLNSIPRKNIIEVEKA